jgi:hypothetical protein
MPHRVTNQQSEPAPHGDAFTPALVTAALVLACARVIGAFLRRAQELRAVGRLPVRRPAYVPVRVHDRAYAAVQVGGSGLVTPMDPDGEDIDDMGLLAKAMSVEKRTRRPLVEYVDQKQVRRPAPRSDFPADLFEDRVPEEAPVHAAATMLGIAAVLAGIPAIVRPLEPWAPWLAGLAIALGASAWWLSRRN